MRIDLKPADQGRTLVEFDGEQLAIGTGAVCCQAARELRERGMPDDTRLEFWRGGTLCLSGPLAEFARLTVKDDSRGVPRFRPWVPFKARLLRSGSGADELE